MSEKKIKTTYEKNRPVGMILTAIAAVCTLVAMIFLIVTGADEGDLGAWEVILLAVGVVAAILPLIKFWFGIPSLFAAVCTAIGIVIPIVLRLNMIGLYFSNVVPNAPATELYIGVAFGLLAVILNCIVGFMGTKKKVDARDQFIAEMYME